MNNTIHKQMPPAELREKKLPELAELMDELERLRALEAATTEDEIAAEDAVKAAEEEDRQHAADLERRKRKRPHPLRAPKARENADGVVGKAAGVRQAAADAEAELQELIEKTSDEISKRIDEEDEPRREACLEAVGKLAEVEAERVRLRALRGWIQDPHRAFAPVKFSGSRVDLTMRNGERARVTELLAVLEANYAPPEPPKPAPPVQSLKRKSATR
jgi:hypothetical protein